MKISFDSYIFKRISKEKHLIVNNSATGPCPAIFFDRDGVLIEDKHYISNPDDVKLFFGVKKLLKLAKKKCRLNIIVTNQSGIDRGYFSWDDYEKVTSKMLEIIGFPNYIDAIYACGSSSNDILDWRKPSPNMLLEAKNRFHIKMDESIMIGDRISDLKAGLDSGVRMAVHVLTGKGKKERDEIIKYFNFPENNENYQLPFKAKINNKNQEVLLINNLLDFKIDYLN